MQQYGNGRVADASPRCLADILKKDPIPASHPGASFQQNNAKMSKASVMLRVPITPSPPPLPLPPAMDPPKGSPNGISAKEDPPKESSPKGMPPKISPEGIPEKHPPDPPKGSTPKGSPKGISPTKGIPRTDFLAEGPSLKGSSPKWIHPKRSRKGIPRREPQRKGSPQGDPLNWISQTDFTKRDPPKGPPKGRPKGRPQRGPRQRDLPKGFLPKGSPKGISPEGVPQKEPPTDKFS